MSISPPSVRRRPADGAEQKMPAQKSKAAVRNTAHLPQRLGFDLLSAAAAGMLVAPVITLIDKSIIENASGRAKLGQSVRNSLRLMFLRPSSYFVSKPFGLICFLYTSTYITANITDTVHSTLRGSPASTTAPTTSKFIATSATNMSLSLYKDSAFTKLFGPPQSISLPARTVPFPTFLLFGARDTLTIFASFIAPPVLSKHLPPAWEDDFGISRVNMVQFAAPALMQAFSTPLHLLGLDLYNRPSGANGCVSLRSRAAKVATDWAKSASMRVARIVPAFGIGGVVNTSVRKTLMANVEAVPS